MIQDIFPHKLFNQFCPGAKAKPDDIVFPVFNADIAVKSKDPIAFFTAKDFKEDADLCYLFSLDDTAFFQYVFADGETPETLEFDTIKVMDFRGLSVLPQEVIYAVFTAKHLSDWYRDTAFCGRCGAKMQDGETERNRHCPQCGYNAYPRIMPAVIVGVLNGDRILITGYRMGYAHNALVAGFTEIGETLEETVAREVMEETGVKVVIIMFMTMVNCRLH